MKFFLELKQTNKKTNFELKFSPARSMCQCQPPSTLPLSSPHDIAYLSADGALSCPTAKARWRNGAIVKIILGQNTGTKPKLVLLDVAWLFSFSRLALCGNTLIQNLPKWQVAMTFYTKSNANGGWAYWFFAKPCRPGHASVNECAGWARREIKPCWPLTSTSRWWDSCLLCK